MPILENKKQQSSPAPQQKPEALKTKVSVNQKQQQHVGPSQKIVIDVKTEAPQPQPSTVAKVRLLWINWAGGKDFPAFRVGLVRRMTAATAAVTLACLFTERLCYVLGRLHSTLQTQTL